MGLLHLLTILGAFAKLQTAIISCVTSVSTAFTIKSCPLLENVGNYGRARQVTNVNVIWRMLTVCWINTATNTRSKYITLNGFPRQQGTAVAHWLRRCATNRKVAGSIPDVIGIFHSHNPSDRTMALGSTQTLTETSTRTTSWR